MTPELLREKPIQRCIEATASIFNAVVEKGISKKAPSSFRQSLVRDVQNFSAFKTYHHLKETAEHVFKKDGSMKTWQEFLKDTAKINEKYNKNWLRAEYQFATASAHMADKWLKFVEDKENIDLVYSTAGDHLVRPDHALLDGVCLPVDDPAWATIYPPNGWGCRCTVYSILKGSREYSDSKKAIEQMEEMTKGKEEIFRFNPGIEQCLFPKKHAYFGKEGSKERKEIKENINAKEELYTPSKSVIETTEQGRKIELYDNVDTTKEDYNQVLAAARYFAQNGEDVEILPNMQRGLKSFEYENIYTDLIGTEYEGKCPDLRCTKGEISIYREVKGYTENNDGKRALKNMLNRALDQSSRVVLKRHPEWTDNFVNRSIRNRIRAGENIDEVWIQENETSSITLIYKKTEG